MRPSKPTESEFDELRAEDTELRLRLENQELKRQLQELKAAPAAPHTRTPAERWRPSSLTIWSLALVAVVLFAVAFFAGYLPLRKRTSVINGEAAAEAQALPRVEVIEVTRSSQANELRLPGNIEAITEAPLLARADGYIQRRLVDIGDHVTAGQTLAIIEAVELDQQVVAAKANLQQAQATLEQALASYEQGKGNMELARDTAQRWTTLVGRGVVSQQENEQYQTQFKSQIANLRALDKAVAAQRSSVAAAEANVSRFEKMQSYLTVKAPFDGVITLRNVDAGALVTAGTTLLFRIAQTGVLRTYVNVPQTNANGIRQGQNARVTVSNLPGRDFTGTVARMANSLDTNSRTMLVEVQVPNKERLLMPGMFAQVEFGSNSTHAPLLVPSEALVVRPEGTEIAMVRPDRTVHLQKVTVGRDYGSRMEILSGLEEGETIIPNAGDNAREGLRVDPVPAGAKTAAP